MSIDLKQLVPKDTDLAKRTATVDFRGIKFKIRYISRAAMMNLAESCMVAGYDPKQKGRSRNLNVDKFVDLVAKTIVLGWDNCTPRTLSSIMLMDLSSIPADKMDQPIEFTESNMLQVVKNVHELDNFLQECAVDASLFKPTNDEELTKNSLTSQSGT